MSQNVRNAQDASMPPPLPAPARGRGGRGRADETPGQRLLRLRHEHGYPSAIAAARAIGVNHVTYHHHESGNRQITVRAADDYARHYGVTPATILCLDQAQAPIVGAVIGAGRVVSRMFLSVDLPDRAAAPPMDGQDLECLSVVGSDLSPAYRPGDLVMYAVPGSTDPRRINARECVVVTADDQHLLRVCHLDAGGETWTLSGYNCETQHGVRLKHAAPVVWVHRAAVAWPD